MALQKIYHQEVSSPLTLKTLAKGNFLNPFDTDGHFEYRLEKF